MDTLNKMDWNNFSLSCSLGYSPSRVFDLITSLLDDGKEIEIIDLEKHKEITEIMFKIIDKQNVKSAFAGIYEKMLGKL